MQVNFEPELDFYCSPTSTLRRASMRSLQSGLSTLRRVDHQELMAAWSTSSDDDRDSPCPRWVGLMLCKHCSLSCWQFCLASTHNTSTIIVCINIYYIALLNRLLCYSVYVYTLYVDIVPLDFSAESYHIIIQYQESTPDTMQAAEAS